MSKPFVDLIPEYAADALEALLVEIGYFSPLVPKSSPVPLWINNRLCLGIPVKSMPNYTDLGWDYLASEDGSILAIIDWNEILADGFVLAE
jgi:hypothetical protein